MFNTLITILIGIDLFYLGPNYTCFLPNRHKIFPLTPSIPFHFINAMEEQNMMIVSCRDINRLRQASSDSAHRANGLGQALNPYSNKPSG